ncbi:MAG: hypothetical protein Q4C88_06525 [Akkermansia sp.]|nr:hypothetical protein [Akkermansia sp.]
MRFFALICAVVVGFCGVCAAQSENALSAAEAARGYGTAVRNFDMAWVLECMYPPLRNTYAEMLVNRGNPAAEAQAARRIMGLDKKAGETLEEARARAEADRKRYVESNRALKAQYQKMGEDMKKQGLKIESFSIGTPTGEYVVTPANATASSVQRAEAARRQSAQGGTALRGNGWPEQPSKGPASETGETTDRSRIVIIPTTLVVSMPAQNGARTRMERKSYIYAVRDEIISDEGSNRETKKDKWYLIDGNTNIGTLRTFFPDLPLYLDRPTCGERILN